MENKMNNYEAFYRGKRVSVQAETSLKAQELAAEKLKARKRWEVSVVLADKPVDPGAL